MGKTRFRDRWLANHLDHGFVRFTDFKNGSEFAQPHHSIAPNLTRNPARCRLRFRDRYSPGPSGGTLQSTRNGYCSVEALPVEKGEFAAGGGAGTASSAAGGFLAKPATVRKHTTIDTMPNSTAPRPRPARTPSAPK